MASIKKRGENTYLITVSNGYDSTGKKLTETVTVHMDPSLSPKKYKAELNRQASEFELKVKNGTFLDGEKITFAEFTERWLKDYAEPELEKKTVSRYKEMLDTRILPAIGHIKLAKLQPTHLISFYNNLREDGIRLDTKYKSKPYLKEALGKTKIKALAASAGVATNTASNALLGQPVALKSAKQICKALNLSLKDAFDPVDGNKTLSSNTIHHHHSILSSMLSDAVEWQVIESNPADRVPIPKVTKKIPRHYNHEQTLLLLNALESEPIMYRTMVILDAFTGFRSGEFMGLDWTDIDMETGEVTVTKVSQYLSGEGTFTKERPKNEESVRSVVVPPFVISLLRAYKSWWNEQKLSCGELWQGSNRLFITWDGRPLYTYSLANWMPDFLKRHNLPKLTPHGIRHTFASLLAKKISIPELAKLLGHARPSTTSDIYVHFLKDNSNAAANLLEDMLVPGKATGQ